MGIFDEIRARGAAYRLTEEALYAEALREIESGERRDGIWAKALAESDMDQGKAGAKYIRLRVQSLKDEITVLLNAANVAKLPEPIPTQIASYPDRSESSRHPKCGGIIDRTEQGRRVRWKCRECGATGQFDRGVDYTMTPLKGN